MAAGPATTPLLGTVMESKTTPSSRTRWFAGIAVLLVLFFHYAPGMALGGPLFHPGAPLAYVIAPIIRLGWSGVDLFFSSIWISDLQHSHLHAQCTQRADYVLCAKGSWILPLYSVLLILFIMGIVLERTGILHLPRLFGDVRQIGHTSLSCRTTPTRFSGMSLIS